MTGRGAGYCAGNDRPGFATPGFGRGWFGRGRGGFGRGRGRGFWGWVPDAPPAYAPSPEQERASLKAQAGALQQQLDTIKQRLASLEEDK